MSLFVMDIHKVLKLLKLFGNLISIWPPEPKASKFELLLRNLGWMLAITNVTGLLVPLILAVYYYRDDVTTMMKALSELTALIEVWLNLILCRLHRNRLQILIERVKNFATDASKSENIILQKYIDRYKPFSLFVGISYIMCAIAFSSGPLLLKTTLPAETWYPFSIEPLYRKVLIYCQQVLAILQTGFCIVLDFNIAMFLWYPAARLEMLGLDLQNVSSMKQMRECAKSHQQIIRFVRDSELCVHNMLFKTNVTMAAAVICGAFQLIYHEPLPVVSQFICMVIGGCLRLYVTAWPADDLREMSLEIGSSIYNSPWIGKSSNLSKSISIMIRRSQQPLMISMSGVLPALSLRYYGSFLYTTLSYFMTMRAVIG